MRNIIMKCFVSLSLVVCFCLLSSISVAQTTLPTEPLFEGAKKYGMYERFLDALNEKRCIDYMKQWEVVTDYDGKPLPASDPYVKQLVEEREKYGVSARDVQNENQWYMKFMDTEDWYAPANLTLIREDGQIR